MDLKKFIRDVPDFPIKGIIFKDITPLLQNAQAFSWAIEQLAAKVQEEKVDQVLAVESRGFIFGAALAYKLQTGFVPLRKPGKLPYKTFSESYQLEYGENTLQIHQDALRPGENVVIVDDLLATGGTVLATTKLVEKMGAKVSAILFLIELDFLKGREKLSPYRLHSLLHY